MFAGINMFWLLLSLWWALRKLKKMTPKQSEQLREHLQVEWLLFSLNENTQYIKRSWLEITKSCHFSFQNL